MSKQQLEAVRRYELSQYRNGDQASKPPVRK